MSLQLDLYELIHTMSKTEKRYFSIFAKSNKSRDVNYLALFEAFSELGEFDEKLLVRKFLKKLENSPFKDPEDYTQLSQDTQYLYKTLLRAMRDYMQKSSVQIQIRDLLSDAIFLRDRGLYQQADKRIVRARKLAQTYHNNVALLEVNRLERSLIWSVEGTNAVSKTEALIAEKDAIMQSLKEEMEHEDLYANISNMVNHQNQFVANDEQVKRVKDDAEALFAKKESAPPAFAKLRQYHIEALLAMGENRLEECEGILEEMMTWWETNKSLKEEESFRYQISLSKLLTFLSQSDQHDKLMARIEEIREANKDMPNGEAILFRFAIFYELFYYINNKKVDEAYSMLPYIEAGMAKYAIPIKRKIALSYNAATVCFLKNEFEACDAWLVKILTYARNNIRKDVMRKAFLLRLIVLENKADASEQALEAAKKYFREEKKVPAKEKIEVQVLNLLMDAMTGPVLDQPKLTKKFLAELEDLQSTPLSSRLNGLVEFYLWCKSRIEKKSILEVFMKS